MIKLKRLVVGIYIYIILYISISLMAWSLSSTFLLFILALLLPCKRRSNNKREHNRRFSINLK